MVSSVLVATNFCKCGCRSNCGVGRQYIKGHQIRERASIIGSLPKRKRELKPCFLCGKMLQLLTKHLHRAHGLNDEQIKEILPKKYCKCGCGLITEKENDYIFNHQHYGRMPTEETRQRLRLGQLQRETPANLGRYFSKEWKRNLRRHMIPNKAEIRLLNLLNKIIPNQFSFVGNWKLSIDSRYPDFVHIRMKKLVEFLGCYYHNCQKCYPNLNHFPDKESLVKRRNVFKKEGYSVLYIWEHEFKNESKLEKKILNYV